MRLAILTGGGDTPGMNAVIRAAYKASKSFGFNEIIGIRHGWKGLLEKETMELTDDLIDRIHVEGGTILGTSRTNPFKTEEGGRLAYERLQELDVDGLIAIGGDDTLGVANKLHKLGAKIVGVPKTIDNDLSATDYTFGFDTAVSIAADAINRLHSTAKAHERTIVVECMGRNAGWITLYAGIAGGAHVILIPEFPMDVNEVIAIVQKRYRAGKRYAIIAISEGYPFLQESEEDVEKDEFGHLSLASLGRSEYLAKLIQSGAKVETRNVVLGHVQRAGTPTAWDRVLSARFGILAAKLIRDKQFGKMVSLRGNNVKAVKLSEAVSELNLVSENLWNNAKLLFG